MENGLTGKAHPTPLTQR